MALVTLTELEKTYNKGTDAAVHALKGVSLSIDSGEMVAVVGTSGSGKSTLLHILSCLDQDFDGQYTFEGTDIQKLSAKHLSEIRNDKVGIVLQNFGLIYDMTVFDNIAMPVYLSGKRYSKKELRNRIAVLLKELGLEDKTNTKASQLSGGQKQRIAIARALINNPALILADEPTGALDKTTSSEIMEILCQLNAAGRTIVLVTHDMDVAAQCKRVITISDGCILGDDTSNNKKIE